MNWLWHALWLCFVIIPVTILWLVCIWDVIVNRRDLSWVKRLGYLLLVLIPFVGAIIYVGITPRLRGADMGVGGRGQPDTRPMVAAPPGQVMG